eukprot:m.444316 g.444316  ORF g.444316 m.444316 type:complete len:272 (-) comp20296_c11_seq13:480-1295(-)
MGTAWTRKMRAPWLVSWLAQKGDRSKARCQATTLGSPSKRGCEHGVGFCKGKLTSKARTDAANDTATLREFYDQLACILDANPDLKKEPGRIVNYDESALPGGGSTCRHKWRVICQDNDCILLTLPSNTSHVLQPLDVHGFNIFKNTFFALIENIHTVYSSPYFFLSELDLSLQQYHHGQSPENQFYRALNIEHNLSPRTQPLATNTHFCGRAGLLETASLAPDGGIRAHGFVSARPRKGHHQQRSFAPTRQPPRNPWAPPRTTEAFRKAG